MNLLYKYRGLSSFRFFVDIVLKNRVYAAPYFDLNDPMEGLYLYNAGELDRGIRSRLQDEKQKTRLCSFSERDDIELIWAHYAEGHRGVAVGVEVDPGRYLVKPIVYGDPYFLNRSDIHNDSVIDILTRKTKPWRYEKEVRAFVTGKHFIQVSVREIVLGSRMSNQDIGFVRDLVERINPSVVIRTAPVAPGA